jgi:hypothetical protein
MQAQCMASIPLWAGLKGSNTVAEGWTSLGARNTVHAFYYYNCIGVA